MSVKKSSWVAACVTIVYGMLLAYVVFKFGRMYAELQVALPPLTFVVFLVGPLGWLGFSVLSAFAIIFTDVRRGPRVLIPILLLFVSAVFICSTLALLSPMFYLVLPVG